MLAWVTRGSAMPGVRAGSGSAMEPAAVVAAGRGAVVASGGATVFFDAGATAAAVVAGAGCGCVVGATVVDTGAAIDVVLETARVSDSAPLHPPAPRTTSAATEPPITCLTTIATRERYGLR